MTIWRDNSTYTPLPGSSDSTSSPWEKCSRDTATAKQPDSHQSHYHLSLWYQL